MTAWLRQRGTTVIRVLEGREMARNSRISRDYHLPAPCNRSDTRSDQGLEGDKVS